jgi:hypothetical protein
LPTKTATLRLVALRRAQRARDTGDKATMSTPTCAPDNEVALAKMKITGSYDRVIERLDECQCGGGELSDFSAVSTVSPALPRSQSISVGEIVSLSAGCMAFSTFKLPTADPFRASTNRKHGANNRGA